MADESHQSTAAANARWFADNDRYIKIQSSLEHYQHIHRMVVHEFRGHGGVPHRFSFAGRLLEHRKAA